MTTMDKAAIGWSIAIVAIGVAIAFGGQTGQDAEVNIETPDLSATTISEAIPEEITDPFSEIADKVKQNSSQVIENVTVPAEKIGQELKKEIEESASGPKTVNVSIAKGTGTSGCEETDECYIPSTVRIFAGDTVVWINEDTVMHTVTAGSPLSGPTGKFDSTLLEAGETFTVPFDGPGTYDYYCIIHRWMVGTVQVN